MQDFGLTELMTNTSCEWTQAANKNINGYTLATKSTNNIDDCKRACNSDSACRSIIWVSN